jgi:hypothetical protein
VRAAEQERWVEDEPVSLTAITKPHFLIAARFKQCKTRAELCRHPMLQYITKYTRNTLAEVEPAAGANDPVHMTSKCRYQVHAQTELEE